MYFKQESEGEEIGASFIRFDFQASFDRESNIPNPFISCRKYS